MPKFARAKKALPWYRRVRAWWATRNLTERVVKNLDYSDTKEFDMDVSIKIYRVSSNIAEVAKKLFHNKRGVYLYQGENIKLFIEDALFDISQTSEPKKELIIFMDNVIDGKVHAEILLALRSEVPGACLESMDRRLSFKVKEALGYSSVCDDIEVVWGAYSTVTYNLFSGKSMDTPFGLFGFLIRHVSHYTEDTLLYQTIDRADPLRKREMVETNYDVLPYIDERIEILRNGIVSKSITQPFFLIELTYLEMLKHQYLSGVWLPITEKVVEVALALLITPTYTYSPNEDVAVIIDRPILEDKLRFNHDAASAGGLFI